MAYGAVNAAYDQGLQIPGDISIHGFDDLDLSTFIRPALSTVHRPLREMGLKAAEVMIHILEHEPVPDDERGILLPCTLVPRSSIRENPME